MDILYASNNKFIPIMMTSIVSLLENTSGKIRIHIISDKISADNKQKVNNIVKKYQQDIFFWEADRYINRVKIR